MHCTACDADLILTNVVPENTGTVHGFEHHTLFARDAMPQCVELPSRDMGVRRNLKPPQVCLAK